jgi:hypothetical protein
MKRLISISIFFLLCWFLGCAEEENVIPVSAGMLIKTADPFGEVFVFPSQQMDGVFYYYQYGWEDFGNTLSFYDFQTSRPRKLVYGWNDDGRGQLINNLTEESLVKESQEGATSGRIYEVFLHTDGSLIFQTETDKKYRISVRENREIQIVETTITNSRSAFKNSRFPIVSLKRSRLSQNMRQL